MFEIAGNRSNRYQFLANCIEVLMGPKPVDERSDHDLFRSELVNLIDQRQELVRLGELIDWQAFADGWSLQFVSTTSRPALPTRLMGSLLYLKHVYALSDEDTVARWSENPYWQHFSGERYFQHELPCDPSSLVRWRQRIGEAGCEWLLAQSIAAATKGRVIRDVQRKGGEITGVLKQRIETAQRLYEQRRDSKNKLYALHAPEVECIAKGKARTPYEFGVKVSVAVTAKEGLVVCMRSMPGNPYDGHTVDSQIEQIAILSGVKPKIALVDGGYRGVEPAADTRLLVSHTRRLPRRLKKLLKRRQVVEPMIGQMKADGLPGRELAQGPAGRCDARDPVRGRAQLENDLGAPAGALLRRPRAARLAALDHGTAAMLITSACLGLKTGCSGPTTEPSPVSHCGACRATGGEGSFA